MRLDIHITRSHYRTYTINCFASPNQTNTDLGTPGNEATERTGSPKPNYKGWVGRTASEFAVGLKRTTVLDSSGDAEDFGNSWKRSDWTNRQLNEETVPFYQKRDIPNFTERTLRLLRSPNAKETGRN